MASDALLKRIAVHTMELLADLISVMEQAADQIAEGQSLKDISIKEYQLYIASNEEINERSLICILSSDDYFDLISKAASEMGVCLDDTARIDVRLPETEFEDGLVTGGFQAWKGISVEMRNESLEALLGEVCERLRERGIEVRCASEEDVIFSMPLKHEDLPYPKQEDKG